MYFWGWAALRRIKSPGVLSSHANLPRWTRALNSVGRDKAEPLLDQQLHILAPCSCHEAGIPIPASFLESPFEIHIGSGEYDVCTALETETVYETLPCPGFLVRPAANAGDHCCMGVWIVAGSGVCFLVIAIFI
jgi:hypothetical protein